jgi:hypothetical protein
LIRTPILEVLYAAVEKIDHISKHDLLFVTHVVTIIAEILIDQ